ncbi:MAG TPA: tRNA (adenosine(37)-N6)-threonylcarbamoyltransferase complex ATPase subunit type 1 TsaE [Verrucomicrobiales bacterium]|nr:tRNA (adenosine(37)-N6)-threonylcarbamoyltransferase complex ATPase subunit type 1 TsaE [Verrucomicrobiales bacterium]
MSEEDGASILINEAATEAFGEDLGRAAGPGDVICLCGTLGAGKTRLVMGMARALGSGALVTSPTFSIVHEYVDGRVPLFHFDLYRLETAEELWALGWEDYLDREGVVAVEWADRFPEMIPAGASWWRLEQAGTGRRRIVRRLGIGEGEPR